MKHYKFDKIDKYAIKISLYVISSLIIIYLAWNIIDNIPSICKGVFSGIFYVLGIFKPLWIGLILSYLLLPVVRLLKRLLFRKKKKNEDSQEVMKKKDKGRMMISIIITYVLIIGIFVSITIGGVFMVKGNLKGGSIDSAIGWVQNYVIEIKETFVSSLELRLQGSDLISNTLKDKITNLAEGLEKVGESIFNFILNFLNQFKDNIVAFIIGIVLSFYVMVDLEYFKCILKKVLRVFTSSKNYNRVVNFTVEVDQVLSKYIRGQLLDCLIVGILSIIGMFLVGLPFAIFIGLFAGIVNIIPYFGPIIGAIPAILVGLFSSNPIVALWAFIVLMVIQQIDANIIVPKIVGGSVGLHPVFVVLSILVGARFGILGMVIAVPIAGIIKLIIVKIAAKLKIVHDDGV